MRWTVLAGLARTFPATLSTSCLHGRLGRAALGALAFFLLSFGWGAGATAAVYYWIPIGDVKPIVRAELGAGTGSHPQVLTQTGPDADYAAEKARDAAGRPTVTVKLGFPMVEQSVVEGTSGRPDRGFALRDTIWFGIGERTDAFFGYELMLGYRAAGLGLLAGALGGYAVMLEEFSHGWRYRAQVRVEVPCPWTRVPFQINLRWDPSSDGAMGAQLVLPIAWSFAVYGGLQRATSFASYEKDSLVSTASARSQQVIFGISIDMFEHFRLRQPR